MKFSITLALGLSLLLALILRVPDLDQRPFHNDEAVNAVKAGDLLEQGGYRYDPDEFHGPLLPYGTLLLVRATSGASAEHTTEASFRWLALLFGVALIPLLWMIRDALGKSATRWAAWLTALSPSLVFFSRDYIHEMLLVAVTFLLIACLWRYACKPHWKWALAAGVAVGLMHATKETFVLNLAAMGIACGLLRLWPGKETDAEREGRRRFLAHGLLMVGAWALVALVLFSSFGSNASGPLDSVRSYLPWLNRAGGESPHIHPWWFYAERLFWWDSGKGLPWTEVGLLLFAMVGGVAGFTRRGLGDASGGFIRWLALYSGILFVIYTIIPYKTPWCVLGAAHGMVLLAGVGLAVLWRRAWQLPQRVALSIVTLLFVSHTTWQAWALSHSQVSARRNPWAYADTAPDLRNLLDLVEEVATASPRGHDLNLQVICDDGDYWPLPYYLRKYSGTGWWSEAPAAPFAPVLIVSSGTVAEFEENPAYVNTGTFQLRHGVFLSCYVEQGLWEAFLKSRRSD